MSRCYACDGEGCQDCSTCSVRMRHHSNKRRHRRRSSRVRGTRRYFKRLHEERK